MPSAKAVGRMAGVGFSASAARFWLTALSLAAVAALGCASRPAAPPLGPRGPALPDAPVSLSVNPTPPRQLVPTIFTVTQTAPLPEGAAVSITLTMPAMPMPPTVIRMMAVRGAAGTRDSKKRAQVWRQTQNTVFRGEGSFTMGGEWLAEVKVVSPRGAMERQIRLHVR